MNSNIRQRALITGASRGIGKATALAFAKSNIDVALVSRSKKSLEEVAEEVDRLGARAGAYPLDLAEVESVRARVEAIANDFGTFDILINNAGMAYTGDALDVPLDRWQQVLNLNLTSAFECTRAVLPAMRAAGSGTIVNIVSIAGKQAFPGWSAYCASKFGLLALSQSLAAEERARGIRVVALCPGATNTPFWDTETVRIDLDRTKMLAPETVARTILQAVLLPAEATMEEVTLAPSAGIL